MQQEKFKPGISMNPAAQETDGTDADTEKMEFTKEQTANQMRMHEEDFLQGLIDAACYAAEERKVIEIARKDPSTGESRVYFRFTIRPLAEEEYDRCKKKHTKYVRNKSIGVKMPEDTNAVKYRDALIYQATVEEDRAKLWDNKKAWEVMRDKGLQIMNGLDVIEYSLKAGEKDAVIDEIDKLSGYGSNLEEVVKN